MRDLREGGFQEGERLLTAREVMEGWLKEMESQEPDTLPVVLITRAFDRSPQQSHVRANSYVRWQDIVTELREAADHIERTERRRGS